MKSSYNTDLRGSMKGSDNKFFLLNFFVECLVLAQFPEYIVEHAQQFRDIILPLENYSSITVIDVFILYKKIVNWTIKFVEIFGSLEVTSKIHKMEHFVLETILVIQFKLHKYFFKNNYKYFSKVGKGN